MGRKAIEKRDNQLIINIDAVSYTHLSISL